MMTIKQFASLCGCNTQTLRYYDKIDLLKPVKVDQWSGYRYYTKSQAIDFVKIKNLQAADFSIDEIKGLVAMPDQQVYEAFNRKITYQTQKLERIKEIQQTYLSEVNTMKKMINSFCDHLLERANDPEMLREFGLESNDAPQLVAFVRDFFVNRPNSVVEDARNVTLTVNGEQFRGARAVENMTVLLRGEELKGALLVDEEPVREELSQPEEDMETFWEYHGWAHAYEFLDKIPPLEEGRKHACILRIHDKLKGQNLSYPLLVIGALLQRGHHAAMEMHCAIEPSTDGQNHFILLRNK